MDIKCNCGNVLDDKDITFENLTHTPETNPMVNEEVKEFIITSKCQACGTMFSYTDLGVCMDLEDAKSKLITQDFGLVEF